MFLEPNLDLKKTIQYYPKKRNLLPVEYKEKAYGGLPFASF